jgi:hypothetical protein
LINDAERMEKLSTNISRLAMRDSANVIAHEVMNLVKR